MTYFLNIILFVSFTFFISCNNDFKNGKSLQLENPIGFYGEKYKPHIDYNISSLLNDSDNLLGDIVEVTGKVTEVCPLKGCWVKISDVSEKKTIRVKVKDGEIIFPLKSVGKQINVRGILNKISFTEQQAINWKVHLEEEKGIFLNPETVKLTKEDLFEYRIDCISAEIF